MQKPLHYIIAPLIMCCFLCINCGDAPIDKYETYTPNSAPVISALASDYNPDITEIAPGIRITLQAEAYDPNNDELTYSFSSEHGSFTNQATSEQKDLCTTEFIIGDISGNETVTIQLRVFDSRGASTIQSLDIGTSKTGPRISLRQSPTATIATNGYTSITFTSDSDGYYQVRIFDKVDTDSASIDTTGNIFYINRNISNTLHICAPQYTGEMYAPGIPRLNPIEKTPDKIFLIVSDLLGQETNTAFTINLIGSGPQLTTSSALSTQTVASNSIAISWNPAEDTETSQQNLEYRAYYSESTSLASLTAIETSGNPAGDWEKGITYKNITGLKSNTTYYINVVVKDAQSNKNIYSMIQKTTGTPGVITNTQTPASGSTIANDDSITITFSEPVEPSSLTLSGDLSAENAPAAWSGTNDEVTITPATLWTHGSNKTVSLNITDTLGNSLPQIDLVYHILNGNIFVHTSGSDNNPGTEDLPKASIRNAIDTAAGLFATAHVIIAAGNYQVANGVPENYIIMRDGISLYGGFSSSDWSDRDPQTYTTDISVAPNAGVFNRVIDCGVNVTSSTVIDGLSFNAADRGTSHGVYCYNSSPTITNNVINASTGIYAYSASPVIRDNIITGKKRGIRCRESNCLIENNTVQAGNDSDSLPSGCAIVVQECTSSTIRRNTLKGGTSSQSCGIYTDQSTGLAIRNNTIHGGSGSSTTTGINLLYSTVTIQNNTIYAEYNGTTSTGIELFNSSPVIENNIIFTSNPGYCIRETSDTFPASLRNNNLFQCSIALYADNTNGNLTTITDINNPAQTGATLASGNITEDLAAGFLLIDADNNYNTLVSTDWTLHAATPVSVYEGGLDLSASFVTDKNNNTRTGNWSMGAYEKN